MTAAVCVQGRLGDTQGRPRPNCCYHCCRNVPPTAAAAAVLPTSTTAAAAAASCYCSYANEGGPLLDDLQRLEDLEAVRGYLRRMRDA